MSQLRGISCLLLPACASYSNNALIIGRDKKNVEKLSKHILPPSGGLRSHAHENVDNHRHSTWECEARQAFTSATSFKWLSEAVTSHFLRRASTRHLSLLSNYSRDVKITLQVQQRLPAYLINFKIALNNGGRAEIHDNAHTNIKKPIKMGCFKVASAFLTDAVLAHVYADADKYTILAESASALLLNQIYRSDINNVKALDENSGVEGPIRVHHKSQVLLVYLRPHE
ncbi:hypothetical protein J6590_077168 [Homalodisca vitripennis]|nr:hypothetical protein J6590_087222 [Homalodisca vitripennis]KAG8335091.1 hypothetical protein J6590_077168 [Homalodisca vitripennis]